MIRTLLTLSLLAGVVSTARAANAPAPNLSKLERTAQHVFELADADKNGSLNPAEQAQADLRAVKAIRQLVHDNIIGGQNRFPGLAEPNLADPAAMTAPEFAQHFQVLVANKDAALRASRIAKHQAPMPQPAVIHPAPVVAAVRDRGRDQSENDRHRDRRNYRDDNYYSRPQAYFQPNPVQYAPSPVFTPPVQRDPPAPAHQAWAWKNGPMQNHGRRLGK